MLISVAGEGGCFLVDAVSYIAVVGSLLMMRIRPVPMPPQSGRMLEQIAEGWQYVHSFRPIRTILTLFALLSLMGWPYSVLLPVFASQVLHGGPHTLGWLTGASGVGALISALSLAARRSVVGLTRMLQVAATVLGGGLVLFGLSHSLWLSLPLMMLIGFGLMQAASVANTVIQSVVPDDKRARVMSYYTMAFFGMAPFGSLFAGALAHLIGAPSTVMVTGVCCIAGAAWFTLERPKIQAVLRPIYRELGLLPA
jgi:MFS family permease